MSRLKNELTWLRRRGAVRVDDGANHVDGKTCARCRMEFGLIFNKGAPCRSCRQKVCKQCRLIPPDNTEWVCTVCHKNIEIQIASGEWMNEFIRRPSRRKDARGLNQSSDLVKKSLRRSWTISSPVTVCLETEEIIKKKQVPRKPPRFKAPPEDSRSQPDSISNGRHSNPQRRYSMSSFDAPSSSKHLKGPAPTPPLREREEKSKSKRRLPELPSKSPSRSKSPTKPDRPSTLPRQPRRKVVPDIQPEEDSTRFHSIPRRKPRSPSRKRGQSDPGRISPVTLPDTSALGGFISSGPVTSTPICNSQLSLSTPKSFKHSSPPKYSDITYESRKESPIRYPARDSIVLSSESNLSSTMSRKSACRTDSGVSEVSRYATSDNSDYDQDLSLNSFKQTLTSPRPRPRIPRSSTSVTSGFATTGRPRRHMNNPAAVKRSKSFQVTGSRTAADEYYSEREYFTKGNVAKFVEQLEMGIQQTIVNMAPKKGELPKQRKSDPTRPCAFGSVQHDLDSYYGDNRVTKSALDFPIKSKESGKYGLSDNYGTGFDTNYGPGSELKYGPIVEPKYNSITEHKYNSPREQNDYLPRKDRGKIRGPICDHCEIPRVDDDKGSYLQSDQSSSDIGIDAERIQPEGDDYKLVFISSDSSKDSELNSSMDSDTSNSATKRTKKSPNESDLSIGYIDENDWDYYKKVQKLSRPVKVDACCMTEEEYHSDISDFASDITESAHDFHPVGPNDSVIYSRNNPIHDIENTETQELKLSFDESLTPLVPTTPPNQTLIVPDMSVLHPMEMQAMLEQTEAVQAEAQALQAALMSAFTTDKDNTKMQNDCKITPGWYLSDNKDKIDKYNDNLCHNTQFEETMRRTPSIKEYRSAALFNAKSENNRPTLNKINKDSYQSIKPQSTISALSRLSYNESDKSRLKEYVYNQSNNTFTKRRKTSRDVCIQTDPVSGDEDSCEEYVNVENYEPNVGHKESIYNVELKMDRKIPEIIPRKKSSEANQNIFNSTKYWHRKTDNKNTVIRNKCGKDPDLGNITVPPYLSDPQLPSKLGQTPSIHLHLSYSREPSVFLTSESELDGRFDECADSVVPSVIEAESTSVCMISDFEQDLEDIEPQNERLCVSDKVELNKNAQIFNKEKPKSVQLQPVDRLTCISSVNNSDSHNTLHCSVNSLDNSYTNEVLVNKQTTMENSDQLDNVSHPSDFNTNERTILPKGTLATPSVDNTKISVSTKIPEDADSILDSNGSENDNIFSLEKSKTILDKDNSSDLESSLGSELLSSDINPNLLDSSENSQLSSSCPSTEPMTTPTPLTPPLTSSISSIEDQVPSDTDDDATKSCCSSVPSVSDDTDEDTHVSQSYDVSKNELADDHVLAQEEEADSGAEGDFTSSPRLLGVDNLNSEGDSSVSASDTDDDVHVSREYTITSSHSDLEEKPGLMGTESPLQEVNCSKGLKSTEEIPSLTSEQTNIDVCITSLSENLDTETDQSTVNNSEIINTECENNINKAIDNNVTTDNKLNSNISQKFEQVTSSHQTNKSDVNESEIETSVENILVETNVNFVENNTDICLESNKLNIDNINDCVITEDNTQDTVKNLDSTNEDNTVKSTDNSVLNNSDNDIDDKEDKHHDKELDKTVTFNEDDTYIENKDSDSESGGAVDSDTDLAQNELDRNADSIDKDIDNNELNEKLYEKEINNELNSYNDKDLNSIRSESCSASGSGRLEHASNAHASVQSGSPVSEHALNSLESLSNTDLSLESFTEDKIFLNSDVVDAKDTNADDFNDNSAFSESGHSCTGDSELIKDLKTVYKSVPKNEDSNVRLPLNMAINNTDGETIQSGGKYIKQSSGDINHRRSAVPPVPARRSKRSSSSEGISSSSDIDRSDADASDSADTIIETSNLKSKFRKLNLKNRKNETDEKSRDSDGPSSADSVLHGGDSEYQCSDGSEEGNLVSIVSVGEDEDFASRVSSQGKIYIRSDSTDSDVQIKPTCIIVTGSSTGDSGAEGENDSEASFSDFNKDGNDVTILEVNSDHRHQHVMSFRVTRNSDSLSPDNRSTINELQSAMMSTREKQQQFRRSPTEMKESSSLANYYTLTLGTDSPHTPRRANKTPEVRRRILPDRSDANESSAANSPSPGITPTPDHSEGDLLAYEENHGIDSGDQMFDSYEENDSLQIYGAESYDGDEEHNFEDSQDLDSNEMLEYEECDSFIDQDADESDRLDSMEDEDNYSEASYEDREEELRGYTDRQFGFTLHTIVEESCEESDYEKKTKDDDLPNRDPSDLEKYFTYGLGNGPAEPRRVANEDSEFSDTVSETSSSIFSEGIDSLDPREDSYMDHAELQASALENYFKTGFLGFERQPSIRSVGEDSELHTDESGSVGSDSEGSSSPEQPRKKLLKPRGLRFGATSRHSIPSDGHPSDSHHSGEDGDGERTFVSGEDEGNSTESEEIAFHNTDGQFDTIKRRKKMKKAALSSDFMEKKSDSDKSDLKTLDKDNREEELKKTEHKKLSHESENLNKRSFNEDNRKRVEDIIGSDLVDRKYQSRDSGFIGSSDDLLRDKPEDFNKEADSKNFLRSEASFEEVVNKNKLKNIPLEKEEDEKLHKVDQKKEIERGEKEEKSNNDGKVSRSSTGSSADLPPFIQNRAGNGLSRKDSFNNWSSDEETNLMMNKMRAFFKNMFLNSSRETHKGQRVKSPQMIMFEAKLVQLMKTVPGINDEQAKEIIEYLSSEDTWSDSYDSSDYTSTSDMEGAYALLDQADPEKKSELQEQISASCQQIIQKFDQIKEPSDTDSAHSIFSHGCSESSEDVSHLSKDTLFVYQNLLHSLKPDSDRGSIGSGSQGTSPTLLAKVIHHIGNSLVELMHEVSGCSENGDDDSLNGVHLVTSSPKQPLFFRKNPGQESTNFDSSIDKSSLASTSFESEDSPTDTEQSPESNSGTPKASRRHKLSIIREDFKSLDNPRTVFASHDLPRHPSRLDKSSSQQTLTSQKSLEERGVSSIQYYVTDDRNKEGEAWQNVTIDEDKFDTREHKGIPRAHRSNRRPETRKAKSHMSLEKIHQDDVKNTAGERSESLGDLLDRVRSSGFSSSYEQLDSDSTLKASGSIDIHMGSSSSNIRLNASSRGSLTTSSRGSLATSSRGSLNAGSRGSLQGSSGPEEDEEKKPKKLSFFRPSRRSSVPDAGKDLSAEVRSTTLPRSNPTQIQPTGSLPRSQSSAQMSRSPPSVTSSAGLFSNQDRGTLAGSGPRSARYHAPGYRPPQMTFGSKRTVSNSNLRKELRTWTTLDESANSLDEGVGGPTRGGPTSKGSSNNGSGSDKASGDCPTPGSLVSSDGSQADEDIQRLLQLEKKRNSLTPLGSRSESMASVYSTGGEGRFGTVVVKGELQALLQYNYKEGQLECHVIQCRDLAPVDTKRNRSDPYVKVYLLPDKSKSGKRKTKVKKHTLNPVFEEILKFSTTMSELDSRTLWISVWHSDMFGRNDFLGEVVLPLADQVFDQDNPKWYPLQERTEPLDDMSYNSPRGDLIIALKFVPPDLGVIGRRARRSKGALHVLIKEAKSLVTTRPHGSADPICKGLLLPDKGKSSKQKTSVCRKTLNPTWNNTLMFEDVSLQDLTERSLELSVWDHDRLGASQFMAGCRLNLGKGKLSGKQVEWMDGVGMEMKLWEQMLDRPNLWVEGSIMLRPAMDKPIYSSSMTE